MSKPHGNNRNKKKKRNKFLQNAKGFAKQGIYGRGTHLEDDQYNYYIQILDAMKGDSIEDVEDRVNMANNVFEQTNGQEIHLASNQIVCKVLESLVGFVDESFLEHYFTTFADNFRPICSDRFASHVLQKMTEIAFLRAMSTANTTKAEEEADEGSAAKRPKVHSTVTEEKYNLEHAWSEEHRDNCAKFVLRIGKFMLNNLEDFVWDDCANHIMRTCILCLAGVHIPKVAFEKVRNDIGKNQKLYAVPEEWIEVAKEFPQRLEMWPQFVELPYSELTSGLLCVICRALRVIDKSMLKHFGKKLLMDALLKTPDADNDEKKDEKIEINDEDEDEQTANQAADNNKANNIKLPMAFQHVSASVLIEGLISVAGPKLLTQLYAMLFAGRLSTLAQDPLTNFAVQKLLNYIKEKEDFENMFTELYEHIEELLKNGLTGVVMALSGACLRLCTKQAQLVTALQSSLHVAGDKEKSKQFFNCLVKLKPIEVMLEDKTAFVHLHGSLIIQHILQFNKPILLVNCILETPADQLLSIFNTPNGSRIVDAFMQSKFIGAKSRERLIQHLENFYVDLAITKHGSHVMEACFEAAAEAQKERIAKRFADRENMMLGSPFGSILHSKYRIKTFKLSASQWKAALQQQDKNKVKELFKDIVN